MRHGGEYRLALASGFSPEAIRFAPEFPTDAELAVPAADLVLDDGGLLLRLERGASAACAARPAASAGAGPQLPQGGGHALRDADGRAAGYGAGAAAQGVREVGLSAMLGLGLRDPEAFSALARALFTCAAALHDSFGLQVSYCCLGGGLPVAHRRTERDATTSRRRLRGCRRNFPKSWSLPVWAACPWRRVLAAGSRPMQASCLQR